LSASAVEFFASFRDFDSKMENRGPELAAVLILFLIITWLIVALRCHVRVRMLKSFGLDDWFMVASLVRINPFTQRAGKCQIWNTEAYLDRPFSLYIAPSPWAEFNMAPVDI